MTDYVVRLTGQDDLSKTIKNVKSELDGVGKSAENIDKIDARFQRITQSTAPLKKQLKDLKVIMAEMNMEGLGNTEQYTEIAKYAGEIKDAMDDAAAATKRFSDDTFALTAMGDAMQVVAGAGSVAAGAMSMFGVDTDNAQKAILKCQQALAVLNGVQAIANKLNKDGALMQALKAVKMNIATAAQVKNTAATNAGTVAQIKNNLAVLANPYVLAAAAVAALTAAIVYWISTMDDATEAEEGLKEAEEAVINATNDSEKEYIKTKMELDQLKITLDNFNGSKEDEKRLVDELNSKYGNSIGKYKDLQSWKSALANVSLYYCGVMKAEAKLAALNAEAYGAWAKAMAGEDFEKNMAKFNKLKGLAEDALEEVNFYKRELNRARQLAGDTSYETKTPKSTKTSSRTTSKSGKKGDDFEKGSLADLEKQKSLKEDMLKKQNLSEEQRKEILEQIVDLEGQIAAIKANQAEEEKKILAEKRKGLDTNVLGDLESPLTSMIKKWNDEFMIKPKIDPEAAREAQERLHALNEKLKDYFDKQREKSEATSEAIGDTFSGLKDTMSSLGSMFDQPILNAAGTIAQAIATYILGWTEATAQAAKLGPWGWAAFTLGTAAQLAAIVAQIHSISGFASGGIIGGGNMYGDHVLARVNSGEMVLNKSQQGRLFKAIESGNIGGGSTVLVPDFRIKGSDLYCSLRNYSKSVGKTGKVTGIR